MSEIVAIKYQNVPQFRLEGSKDSLKASRQ